jgi:hypothetical protein
LAAVDYVETGTPVTPESLAKIVTGALVVREGRNTDVVKNPLAGCLAQYAAILVHD